MVADRGKGSAGHRGCSMGDMQPRHRFGSCGRPPDNGPCVSLRTGGLSGILSACGFLCAGHLFPKEYDMQPELLLFDIGNTCIKVGLADSRGVMTSYNLRTDPAQTSDSLGLTLLELLRHAGAEPRFTACVASSVVPGFDPLLREAVQRYLGCPLWMVPQDMPIPLQNHYERPQEVGADRLVGAYEARRLHPGPESLIVVDFGTAVTFDCISGNAYLGGLIFPGPRTAISALARETAQLPRVNLDVDALEPAPGRSTSVSIQHGLVFGFACMVEGLTQRLKKGLPGDCLVLATGGFAPSIARISPDVFDAVLPSLLLEGLRRLYYERHPY